jgi:hypothetical protein
VDDALTDARFVIDHLESKVKVVDVQFQNMNMMGGVSFSPKLILHVPMSKNYGPLVATVIGAIIVMTLQHDLL